MDHARALGSDGTTRGTVRRHEVDESFGLLPLPRAEEDAMHDGSCKPKLYEAYHERFRECWCSAFGGVHEENWKRDAVGPRGRIQAARGEGKAKAVHEKAL